MKAAESLRGTGAMWGQSHLTRSSLERVWKREHREDSTSKECGQCSSRGMSSQEKHLQIFLIARLTGISTYDPVYSSVSVDLSGSSASMWYLMAELCCLGWLQNESVRLQILFLSPQNGELWEQAWAVSDLCWCSWKISFPILCRSISIKLLLLRFCWVYFFFLDMPDMQPLSPISVHERYSSPTAGSAKRRLFGDDSPKEIQMEKILIKGTKLTIAPTSSIGAENMSVSPAQTVLTMTTTTGPGKAGQKVTIPLHGRNSCCFSSLLGCFL